MITQDFWGCPYIIHIYLGRWRYSMYNWIITCSSPFITTRDCLLLSPLDITEHCCVHLRYLQRTVIIYYPQ
jgi:hypothetical protein